MYMRVLHTLLVATIAYALAHFTIVLGARMSGYHPDPFTLLFMGVVFATVGAAAVFAPGELAWGIALMVAGALALLAARSAIDGLPALALLLAVLSAEAPLVPVVARATCLPR